VFSFSSIVNLSIAPQPPARHGLYLPFKIYCWTYGLMVPPVRQRRQRFGSRNLRALRTVQLAFRRHLDQTRLVSLSQLTVSTCVLDTRNITNHEGGSPQKWR
jgi:hypothetical protein